MYSAEYEQCAKRRAYIVKVMQFAKAGGLFVNKLCAVGFAVSSVVVATDGVSVVVVVVFDYLQ